MEFAGWRREDEILEEKMVTRWNLRGGGGRMSLVWIGETCYWRAEYGMKILQIKIVMNSIYVRKRHYKAQINM